MKKHGVILFVKVTTRRNSVSLFGRRKTSNTHHATDVLKTDVPKVHEYTTPALTSQRTGSVYILKTSRWMLFRQIIEVSCLKPQIQSLKKKIPILNVRQFCI